MRLALIVSTMLLGWSAVAGADPRPLGDDRATVGVPSVAVELARWEQARAAAQASGVTATYRLDLASGCADCTWARLVVWERLESTDRCREGPVAVSMAIDGAITTTAEALGYDCCPGTACADRPPIGWMLDLTRAAAGRDLAALRALFPATGKVLVAGVDGARRFTRRRLSDDAFDLIAIDATYVAGDGLACDPAFVKGKARCTLGEENAGRTLQVTWRRKGRKVSLVSITSEAWGD